MNNNNGINANRKYKDRVFTKLFGEKDKAVELYNAIAGTDYAPGDIEFITLENIIFIGRENDIAFTVDGRLIVLIEHQSSVNPNMPLRCLLYIAREYQMLVDNKAIYSSQLVKILPPEFIVVYNGIDEYPDESELNLSDAFIGEGENNLELKVKVYNVNRGHSSEIMRRSGTLTAYSVFIARARENIANRLELREALEKAVKDCVRDNILRDFLQTYGSDVINMLSMEWNLEDALKVRQMDGEQIKAERVAEKLLRKGMTIEFVVETTELPIERVEEIAKKLGNKN